MSTIPEAAAKPSVLHASLEYRGSAIGGVRVVSQAITAKQKVYGHDVRVVTPFYDFYHKELEDPSFCGFIAHVYEGRMIRSAVYKAGKTNENDPIHYLIKPDPSVKPRLFSLGSEKSIYYTFPHSHRTERFLYFSSAAAALAGSYKGKKHLKSFDALRSSDRVLHVSKEAARASRTKEGGFGLEKISERHFRKGQLLGVTNGINHSDYNPENSQLFKNFAIKKGENGAPADAMEYLKAKEQCKRILAEKGIISDPLKPLFMYVGRYAPEKGIGMLPHMAEEVRNHGGQSIIMGLENDYASLRPILEGFRAASRDPSSQLKFYSELEDQTRLLADTGVSIGKLARLAADAVMVPSHLEACGLVPMEAFSMGALVVTSGVQGLKDTCIGLDDSILNRLGSGPGHAVQMEFNSIIYSNDGNRVENSRQAIRKAFSFLKNTSKADRGRWTMQLIRGARKYDWASENGALQIIEQAYKK